MSISSLRSELLRFVSWFFGLTGILFCFIGYPYLHMTFQSTTLFQNFIADFSSWSGKSLIVGFILTNYICYMLLLSFLLALLPFCITLCFPRRRLITFLTICCSVFGLLGLILDAELYSMYKFHVNHTLLGFIFSQDMHAVFDLSQHELFSIALIIFMVICVAIGLAWGTWKYIIWAKRFKIGKTLGVMWFGMSLVCFFTMLLMLSVQRNNLLIQQTVNLPFYNTLLANIIPKKDAHELLNRSSESHYMQAAFSQRKMHYPLHPMQCKTRSTYNIILIVVDSLRQDALFNMPHTQRFALQSWRFMHHLSGGNCTQAGLFSLFYGLPSTYWAAALHQHVSPIWLDLLQANDYDMRIIASAEMRNPPLHQTIFQNIEHLPLNGSNKPNEAERDHDVTSQAIAYLNKKQQKPFFLNIFYNAPHAFCQADAFPEIYQPYQKRCSRMSMTNQTARLPYYHSYLNTVDFVDKEIQTLLQHLTSKGYLKNSIVIITSDHGQEFNENHQNYWGHASNYSLYQTQIPLIIYWPNTINQTITHTTSSYDVVPTLLTRLFHCQNDLSDYSVGHDLFIPGGRELLIAGSYATIGLIEPDRLTTIHTSGEMNVTDLKLNPLPHQPATSTLRQAFDLMKKYYE